MLLKDFYAVYMSIMTTFIQCHIVDVKSSTDRPNYSNRTPRSRFQLIGQFHHAQICKETSFNVEGGGWLFCDTYQIGNYLFHDEFELSISEYHCV